jgi:pilus assembly protein CpaC
MESPVKKTSFALALLALLLLSAPARSATDKTAVPPTPPATAAVALKPCASVTVAQVTYVVLGKSTVVGLPTAATRLVVGGSSQAAGRAGKPGQAADKSSTNPAPVSASSSASYDGVADLDVVLLSPSELYLLGKKAGSMNLVLQNAENQCSVMDIIVTVDATPLQAQLAELMPEETGIKVRGSENALVLTGHISDGLKLDQALSLATSYGDGKRVVNLLRVSAPHQVMLEVKIAEVSKTLIDKLGSSAAIKRTSNGGENVFSMLSDFLSQGGGLLEALDVGKTRFKLDGQQEDGLVRVLAEPNLMAISGQSASFLSGGKIFIPVAQSTDASTGGSSVTLQEKEYGIGVRFTPTVLDGSRINLKLVSEVSDLSQTGSPFSTVNGVVSVIPSLTVRRADTTVQLNDGQSFVIAGLIKNNASTAIKRFPGLGEVPILGALFRSTEFQKDQTELLFVITPRLVKPLAKVPTLPTSNHREPSRQDVMLHGKAEAPRPLSAPAVATSPAPAP